MWSADELKLMVKEVFDSIAEGFQHVRAKPWSIVRKLSSCRTVIDLGCGTAVQLVPLLGEVYGICIDISSSMLSIARARARKRSVDTYMDTVQADMELLPLRSSAIDCAMSIAALHHLPARSRVSALKEIERVLKHCGKALITVWSLYQPRFLLALIPNVFRYLLRATPSPRDFFIPWRYRGRRYLRYYHLFTKNELRKLIESSTPSLQIIEYGVYNLKRTVFHQNYYALTVKKCSSQSPTHLSDP